MAHSDQYMRGRMFEEVVALLLSDSQFGPGRYLDWELGNHMNAYKVTAVMYETFFQVTKEIVRAGVGSDWNASDQAAWQFRIDLVMSQVLNLSASRSS